MRPYCLLLLTGLHYFFRFLQEEGGISSEILDKHFEDAVRFLAEIAGTTRHDANEQRDDEIFLDSVRELLASGICRLLDDRDPNPHNNAQVIGERNGDLVDLLPAVAMRKVQEMRGTVINPTSLGRALKERGHLAKLGEKGRPQANERVNGRVARVFVLKASVLFPPEKDGYPCGNTKGTNRTRWCSGGWVGVFPLFPVFPQILHSHLERKIRSRPLYPHE